MLRGATMRWTSTWYSETGRRFGWKGPIGLNTDFTFLTFTKFFLQSSRGSERFSHLTEFFFVLAQKFAQCNCWYCVRNHVRIYDTTVEKYNFNSGEKLDPSRVFLFVCECNLAQVAPCHFFFRICLEKWLWYCPCVTKSSPSSACAVSYAALSSKVIIMFDE